MLCTTPYWLPTRNSWPPSSAVMRPAIADMYTEDGKLLPPNSPMLAGKQAIRAFWHGAKAGRRQGDQA